MPTQPFEAQLLITQSTSSCVSLFSVFLFFPFIFASYLVHQFMEDRGNHIYFSQEKYMTCHIQFFLDVNLGSWMQHFTVWFGLFSIVPPIPLNCSLRQPLVHLSSFTCSFVIIFTPGASKRTSLTNLINSSEKTNVHPFHKSGSAP